VWFISTGLENVQEMKITPRFEAGLYSLSPSYAGYTLVARMLV
jgi:hypothetical protein